MAKKKGSKGQTTIYKTLHIKIKINNNSTKTRSEPRCSGRGRKPGVNLDALEGEENQGWTQMLRKGKQPTSDTPLMLSANTDFQSSQKNDNPTTIHAAFRLSLCIILQIFFFILPQALMIKPPYVGSHFGSKQKHFVEDYPRHILAKCVYKGFCGFR